MRFRQCFNTEFDFFFVRWTVVLLVLIAPAVGSSAALTDLTVPTVTVTAGTGTIGVGSQVQVAYTIANGPESVTTDFQTRYLYCRTNKVATCTLLSGVTTTDNFDPDQSRIYNATLTLPNTMITGTGYIRVTVDSTGLVPETSNSNNHGFGAFEVTGQANLQVVIDSITPATDVAPGQLVTINYTLSNNGVAQARAFVFRVYQSTDSTITASDATLKTSTSITINANDTLTASIDVTIPANVSFGRIRYLGIIVDVTQVVGESEESDNTDSKSFKVTSKSDLEVTTAVFETSGKIGAGSTFELNYTIKNNGAPLSANFEVTFYYCRQATIANCTAITTATITDNFSAEQDRARTEQLTLPDTVVNGSGQILVALDSARTVTEVDESNNNRFAAFTVTALPDLTVTVVNVTPTVVKPGDKMTVTYTIGNIGSAAATEVGVMVSWSTSDYFSSASVDLDHERTLDLSANSVSASYQVVVTVPSSEWTFGERYVGVMVDFGNVIAEVSEKNNWAAVAKTLPIVDLTVDFLSVEQSQMRPGDTITISYRLANPSGFSAPPVRFVLGLNYYNNYFIANTLLAETTIALASQSFAPSQTGVYTVSVKVPKLAVLPGTRYIVAYVDSKQELDESHERNNRLSIPIELIQNPDLSFHYSSPNSVVSDPPVGYGTQVEAKYEIRNNQFDLISTDVDVAYFYCPQRADKDCTLLMTKTVANGLAKGGKLEISQAVTLPETVLPGLGYIRVLLDPADTIREKSESDNVRYFSLTVTELPDLKMNKLSVVPASDVVPGDTVSLAYRVENIGLAKSTSCKITFYLSTDAVLSLDDAELTTVDLTGVDSGKLAPSSDGTFATTATLPDTLIPGKTAYIFALVNVDGSVEESNGANNQIMTSFTLTTKLDLDVTAATVKGTGTLGAETMISLDYTIRARVAGVDTSFGVQFYYCRDETPSNCTALTSATVSDKFETGQSRDYSQALLLPKLVVHGSGYIRVVIDTAAAVAEANETNNDRYASIEIGAQPDLRVDFLDVLPASPLPGTTVSVHYRIENLGAVMLDSFLIQFYESTDDKLDNGDKLLKSLTRGMLANSFAPPSSTGTYSTKIDLPITATFGSERYIIVVVDPLEKISESDEGNNSKSALFTIYNTAPTVGTFKSPADCTDKRAKSTDGKLCFSHGTDETMVVDKPTRYKCRFSTSDDFTTDVLTSTPVVGDKSGETCCLPPSPLSDGTVYYATVIAVDGVSLGLTTTSTDICEFVFEAAKGCGEHGTKLNDGGCECEPGYVGPACQFTDAATCTNHGVAQTDGSCICSDGFAGGSCQHSDSATCNSHGTAQDDGGCECNNGNSGLGCEFSDLTTCSGNGEARNDGSCLCDNGRQGTNCKQWRCEGTDAIDCDDKNSCTVDSCDQAIGCRNQPIDGCPTSGDTSDNSTDDANEPTVSDSAPTSQTNNGNDATTSSGGGCSLAHSNADPGAPLTLLFLVIAVIGCRRLLLRS